MRTTFIKTLTELAEKDKSIVVLTGDLGFSVFEDFEEKFPDRYFNVGISEQNMIGMAAGLAKSGKKVYVYSIIPFLTMRPYEQIRIDVCYHNLDVTFVGVGSGFAYGPAGATHHSIEDISILRTLPNMTLIAPGDPIEVERSILECYKTNTPTYIRLSRNNEPIIHNKDIDFRIGKGLIVNKGSKIMIITTGNMLEEGCNILNHFNNSIGLCSMHTLKPFDATLIHEISANYEYIITLEEHNIYGGLFSSVAEVIALNSSGNVRIIPFAINDEFSHYVGSQSFLKKKFNIDENAVIKKIVELI